MFTYQIIIIIISLLAMFLITRRFQKDTLNLGMYLLWLAIWILVIIAAVFPEISIHLASIFGLGRGLDVLYITAIIILFYLLFKLFNRIEDQKKRINKLVSELALQEHENDADDE